MGQIPSSFGPTGVPVPQPISRDKTGQGGTAPNGTVANGSVANGSTTNGGSANAPGTPGAVKSKEEAVKRLQQVTSSASMKVELQYDSKSHVTWVNVVDEQTGKVIIQLPPEAIRAVMDAMMQPRGSKIDESI